MPYLLNLCSLAAAALFVLAILIRGRSLPAGDGLEAQYVPPWEKDVLDASPAAGGYRQALDGAQASADATADPDAPEAPPEPQPGDAEQR
jgi:hypothetical protein